VDATNWLWWFTESGVLPGLNFAIADNGIIVSCEVDTAAPDDELDFPLAAIALVAEFRMDASESALPLSEVLVAVVAVVAVLVAVVLAGLVVVVAFVDADPLAVPPDVLT
jgi:hypothetical protein